MSGTYTRRSNPRKSIYLCMKHSVRFISNMLHKKLVTGGFLIIIQGIKTQDLVEQLPYLLSSLVKNEKWDMKQ